jgi:REP element-mobilizing transposase RayT
MSQSLSMVIVHVIFSTKDRFPCIHKALRPVLHAYLATVVRNSRCEAYRVSGTGDHVHLAIRLSRTLAISELIQEIKTSSSIWIKTQRSELHNFSWQHGYGAFSIGPSDLQALLKYIDNQEEHHKIKTFEEEYRTILNQYGVLYDERYVWD